MQYHPRALRNRGVQVVRNTDSCPETGRFRRWTLAALTAALFCALTAGAEAGPIPDNPRYTFAPIGDELGLASRVPYAMTTDSRGFIWVAAVGGLYRFIGLEGTRFEVPYGGIFKQVIEAPDGTIWIAGPHGLARFDGGGAVWFEHEEYNSVLGTAKTASGSESVSLRRTSFMSPQRPACSRST